MEEAYCRGEETLYPSCIGILLVIRLVFINQLDLRHANAASNKGGGGGHSHRCRIQR